MKKDLSKMRINPHVTEKATKLLAENQYVFKVSPCATKLLVKKAIEQRYNVKVRSVNTVMVEGKIRRFGKTVGKRKNWKKAYVMLNKGYTINLDTSTGKG